MNKIFATVLLVACISIATAQGATCPTLSNYTNCATCNSTNAALGSVCTSCNSGYGLNFTDGGNSSCQACAMGCGNCSLSNSSAFCTYSNDTTANSATSPTPCGNNATQFYTAGVVGAAGANFTYTCYACGVNCSNCTLSNGSKATGANPACQTCATNNSLNSTTGLCAYNATTAAGNTSTGNTSTGNTSTGNTSTGTGASTTPGTCTNNVCTSCNTGYVLTGTSCLACNPACVNCRVANDITKCSQSNGNVTAAAANCNNITYSNSNGSVILYFQAGAANTTVAAAPTYTCYSCAYNCTTCSGNSPATANTTSCSKCPDNTTVQTITVNSQSYTGCFTTSAIMNAGLTLGALLTIVAALLF